MVTVAIPMTASNLVGAGVPRSYAPDVGVARSDLLDRFVARCHEFLNQYEPDIACPRIAQLLTHILTDHNFIHDVIPIEPHESGRHVLYEQPNGLTVLGHYHPEQVWSKPHNHGRTWAIYGVATGRTGMHDWELVEPATAKARGKVRLLRSYWMMPGDVNYYPVGAIHSHITFDQSKLIRIEGVNIRRRGLSIGGKLFDPIDG